MSFYFTSLSSTTEMDNCLKDQIFSEMGKHTDIQYAEYVVLGITHMNGWDFNEDEFLKIRHKPFVIFDFTEYGWNNTKVKHIYGENTQVYIHLLTNKNYIKLDEAIKQVKVKCYFKRELPKSIINAKYPVYPIEYPCLNTDEIVPDTLEQYSKRPIDIFFNWGWSNPSRPELHGMFYYLAEELGYVIVSDYRHLVQHKKEHFNQKFVFSSFTPHFARMSMPELLSLQQQSKISISLNGCGVKCFRHSESPVNSLMALQENDLFWSYDWTFENSIILPNNKITGKLDSENSIRKMIRFLQNLPYMYEKYLNGLETIKLYKQKTYINELLRRITNHQ